MSPSNRTAKRVQALRKAAAAGRMPNDQAEAEIARLEALGASFEARWTLPGGQERFKTFSEAVHGKKAKKLAEAYEAEQKALAKRRETQDHQDLRATLATVLDFYLEHRMHRDGKPKASYKNARAHRDHILEAWGMKFTLDVLDLDPEKHIDRLRAALERSLAVASSWNNKVTCQAAVAYWIRKKRLRILNPFMAYDWPAPDNKRRERISWDQHRKLVAAAGKIAPWLPAFFEMGWETGWRSGEIQDWQAERFDFNVKGEDFPRVETLIEKKGQLEPVYEVKPVTWRAAGIVRSLLAGRRQGPVWPLRRAMHDRYVKRAFRDAGLSHLRFHDYRRTFKKRLEDAGVSGSRGAAYAGHGEDMHQRYNVHALEDHQATLRKLEPEHSRSMEKENG